MNIGDIIQAPYVIPHPTRRNDYIAMARPAVVLGFSHPGNRGDVLVKFEDGRKAWVGRT